MVARMVALVLSSIVFSAGGAFMVASDGFTRPAPSAVVLACFVVGAILLTKAVSRGGLGTTYVVGLGLEAVVSVGVATLVLSERFTVAHVVGVFFILTGLVVVRLV